MRALLTLVGLLSLSAAQAQTGNVIFIHPDGTGVNTWGAGRMLLAGPDGMLNWDRLERVGVYRGHLLNSLTASSNGGGTAHAYGVKVTTGAMGRDRGRQVVSASGKPHSLMIEALRSGLAGGVISSASVTDAGTGVFLASVDSRRNHQEIAFQMIASRANVILGGGEQFFLPQGVRGRHGMGVRTDGVNLIDRARRAGYRVVFTRNELMALPAGTTRVLGLFTADDTFNDETEETLRQQNRPLYAPTAPAIDEMTRVALRVLQATGRRFFLVSEEEATDNFAGDQNAKGVFEALRRADRAIGVALEFQQRNPRTLILTAADSDCGGMQVLSVDNANAPLPARDEETGAMLDGREGTGTLPFLSAPDARGQRFPFAVAWSAGGDLAGGIAARAHGLNSALLPANVQNTDIFRVCYRTLFGRWPRR